MKYKVWVVDDEPMSLRVVKRAGHSIAEQDSIYMMGLLHDVGKIGIQDAIINKTGRLTDQEYAEIKTHPVVGHEILRNIEDYPELMVGARWHHERYDGGGYPDGLVDDTPMNLKVVTKLLRDTEIAVETAESGEAALAKTITAHYDIILMDHQMPGMDGIECLHRIRAQVDGKCCDTKVVCLTANAGADAERMYKDEGFDGYLLKPLQGKALEAELARLMG